MTPDATEISCSRVHPTVLLLVLAPEASLLLVETGASVAVLLVVAILSVDDPGVDWADDAAVDGMVVLEGEAVAPLFASSAAELNAFIIKPPNPLPTVVCCATFCKEMVVEPITNPPFAFREMAVPSIVTADAPGVKVVPAKAMAEGYAVMGWVPRVVM